MSERDETQEEVNSINESETLQESQRVPAETRARSLLPALSWVSISACCPERRVLQNAGHSGVEERGAGRCLRFP